MYSIFINKSKYYSIKIQGNLPMTLKKLFIIIYSSMTILLLVMGGFYYKMLVLQNSMNLAQEMRYNSQLRADELIFQFR
jgi:hypothetical protein